MKKTEQNECIKELSLIIDNAIKNRLEKDDHEKSVYRYVDTLKHSDYPNLYTKTLWITALGNTLLFEGDTLEASDNILDQEKSYYLFKFYQDVRSYAQENLGEKYSIFADYLNIRW